jgi:hypothetical protein
MLLLDARSTDESQLVLHKSSVELGERLEPRRSAHACRLFAEASEVFLPVAVVAAERHDVVACAGLLAEAAIEATQAVLAERREWTLNEQGIVRRARSGHAWRRSWPRRVTARSTSRER